RTAREQGQYPSDVVFTDATDISPHRASDSDPPLPQPVFEAYGFYDRGVMERDFGSVSVHRWQVDGADLYVVRCTTDGSDGWVELYDADGTPLAYARTEYDWPAWK